MMHARQQSPDTDRRAPLSVAGRLAVALGAAFLVAACPTLKETGLLPEEGVDGLRGRAETGDPAAMTEVGRRYEIGDGVALDPDMAIDWYRRAADAGDPPAQYMLGQMYLNGGIQPSDANRAAELFMRAAARGNAPAQAALARLYERGEGVPQDYRRAAQFYALAATLDKSTAAEKLAPDLISGRTDAVGAPESLRWYRRASRLGVADAQYALARAYETGDGVALDATKAEAWYREAAGHGHDGAAAALARLYAGGLAPAPSGSVPDGLRAEAAVVTMDSMESMPTAMPVAATMPAAPARTANGRPRGDDGLLVHLASYRSPEAADAGWAELVRDYSDLMAGLELAVKRVVLPNKGTFYRVEAGPFADAAGAKALCQKMTARGAYCQPMAAN